MATTKFPLICDTDGTSHKQDKIGLNQATVTACNVLIHDQTCVMKILTALYDSEVSAGIVNNVGTTMDPRLAVRISHVEELKSPSKA